MLETLFDTWHETDGLVFENQKISAPIQIGEEEIFSTKDVLVFLISNNMVGAVWSPKHLFSVMNLLFKEKIDKLNAFDKTSYFALICRSAIKDYKTLTFEEIFSTKDDLEVSINKKISSYFGIPAQSASWNAPCGHLQSVEAYCLSERNYMKSTLGTEIQM